MLYCLKIIQDVSFNWFHEVAIADLRLRDHFQESAEKIIKFLEIQKESPMFIAFNFITEKLKFNGNREYKSLYDYTRKQNNDSKLNQSDKKKLFFKRRRWKQWDDVAICNKIGHHHILNQIEQRFTLPKPETGS